MSDQDDLWVPYKTMYSTLIIKTIKLSKKMDLHDYLNGTLYQPCDGWLHKKSKWKIFLISFKSRHHCLTFVLQNFHGWSKCLIECVALCHVCSIIWRSIKGSNEILTFWSLLVTPCFNSWNVLSVVPMSLNLSKKDSQPQVHKLHSYNKLKTAKYMYSYSW